MPWEVEFHDLPIGIVPVDYQGVQVRGRPESPTTEVVTPWKIQHDLDQMPTGKLGFVLIGATKHAGLLHARAAEPTEPRRGPAGPGFYTV